MLSELESITIPSSVTLIGTCCFSHCNKLKRIIIEDKLNENDELFTGINIFSHNQNLEEFIFSKGKINFDQEIFYYCPKMKWLTDEIYNSNNNKQFIMKKNLNNLFKEIE